MAIVKMARAKLTAFTEEKTGLLKALQTMGDVHFVEVDKEFSAEEYENLLCTDEVQLEQTAVREEIDRLELAVASVEESMPPQGLLASLNSGLPKISFEEFEERAKKLDVTAVCDEIRRVTRKIEKNKDEISMLREQKDTLFPYGKLDVSLADLDALKTVQYALGTISKRAEDSFRRELAKTEESFLEILAGDDKCLYFLLLFTDTEAAEIQDLLRQSGYTAKSMAKEKTPSELIKDYEQRILELEAENQQLQANLQKISESSLGDIKLKAEWLRNKEVQFLARENFISGRHVFLLKLYVPLERKEEFAELLAKTLSQPYDLQIESVERDDAEVEEVPVLLKNNALVEPFEDVVQTFATPRYDEIDPTGVVMPWYAVCFGIMLGDMGYGLVLLLLSSLALKLFNLKESTRRTMRFFQILGVPSTIIGGLFGSFFALSIPGIISPTEQTDEILFFSLIFGVVMLFFALGMKGYMTIRDKDYLALVADVVSWFMAVIGFGLVLFGANLGIGEFGSKVAAVFAIAGLLLVLLFSARDEKGFARFAWGLYNVYGASSWIGDIVSYARLAALAMSGGFIGYAVNMIAGMLAGSLPGTLLALVIILIFHPFNIFLSGLSAYVHSLRLIYVEFFGKFFEGGGIPFKKFRAESEYVDVQ